MLIDVLHELLIQTKKGESKIRLILNLPAGRQGS